MFVGKHKVCLGNIGCFSPLDSILKKLNYSTPSLMRPLPTGTTHNEERFQMH
jgi:hypothetical protein